MFFMKPTAQVLRAQDLKDAERDLGAHLKAMEYHGAMADMYAARVARLKAELAAEKAEIAAEKAAVNRPDLWIAPAGGSV